ncbi:Islet amyloid polypeptide [Cuculus canorus]|uniref:Islet amyloid polypeptide n=1 Tax=Cuculus canorus TaxID=55661 RepID=A0A091GJH4_CUCCA|nr:Islet amyloid polypeptide [Cuculus canorus]
MCNLKLSVFFIALSVTLSCLKATPIEKLLSMADDLPDGASKRQGWILPVMPQNTLSGFGEEMSEQPAAKTKRSHQLEKRKCNTATCVTQRLADFLVRSSNSIGAIYPPTNVGSNTYGKRDTAGLLSREPQNNA